MRKPTPDEQLEANQALARMGMTVNPPWAPNMFVINELHPYLETIFSDTEWAKGRWRQSLLKIPGAYRIKEPRMLGGVMGPQIAIPQEEALKLPFLK